MLFSTHTHTHTNVQTHAHTRTGTHTHAHTHTHTYAHAHAHVKQDALCYVNTLYDISALTQISHVRRHLHKSIFCATFCLFWKTYLDTNTHNRCEVGLH